MAVDWTVEATAAAALRARGVESDLSDAALHAFALDATAALDKRLGDLSAIVHEAPYSAYGGQYLFLSVPVASIASIVENGVPLVAGTDYRVVFGGRAIERISSGYPAGWGYPVTVTYDAAAVDTDTYDRIVVDLVKLALSYQGTAERSDGDYREAAMGARAGGTAGGYQDERESILSELAGARWGVA